MNARWMALGVMLVSLAGGVALAQREDLVVAVYVPNAVVASAQARAEFAQALAGQIAAKVGRGSRGMAFARARDFEAAVARGDVHLAVLDPLYVAGRPQTKVLATARRGGAGAAPAIGVARGGSRGISAWRGKRLILPAAGGAETRFVDAFVLEGEVPARQFWAAIATAPDGASAIAAVAAGQADVALVLDSPDARALASQRGMDIVFTTRPVPGAAMAWVKTTPDPALEGALASAVRGQSAGPVGDAWGDSSGGYRELVVAPPMPKPTFGAPATLDFVANAVLEPPVTDLALPNPQVATLVAAPERLR